MPHETKKITDFILLVFMVSLREGWQKIEVQKAWVFSHDSVCESFVISGTVPVLFILFEIIIQFSYCFSLP